MEKSAPVQLILYSRSYCHLCDDLRLAVEAWAAEAGVAIGIDVIDVDADLLLVAQYDELVPVLAGRRRDGTLARICHYFLDPVALRQFFEEIRC